MLLEKEAVLQTITNHLNLHCIGKDSETWKYAEDLIKAFESAPAETMVMPKIATSKEELLGLAKDCDLRKWAILFIIARLETVGQWDWDNLLEEHWQGINKQIEDEFKKLKNDSNFLE